MALVITAELAGAGFAASDPWSPAIDAILGYWHLRERLGEERFALQSGRTDLLVTVEDLPIEKVSSGDQWWYACSSPLYEDKLQHQRYYHRRFDAREGERYLAPRKGKVLTAAGPYKNYRLSQILHVTPRVEWHAIGDGAEIERLLRRCSHIGAKTGMGLGRVRRWRVEEGGDEALARYGRPVPVEDAKAGGLYGPMWWGLRPPGRLRENQCLCVMPHFA